MLLRHNVSFKADITVGAYDWQSDVTLERTTGKELKTLEIASSYQKLNLIIEDIKRQKDYMR